jgi:hypothetical protein
MNMVLLKLSAMVHDTNIIIHIHMYGFTDILQKDNCELFLNAALCLMQFYWKPSHFRTVSAGVKLCFQLNISLT